MIGEKLAAKQPILAKRGSLVKLTFVNFPYKIVGTTRSSISTPHNVISMSKKNCFCFNIKTMIKAKANAVREGFEPPQGN